MRTIGTTVRNTVGALALLTLIPASGWAVGGPGGPGGGAGFQGPPKEAFDACSGKKAGDPVQFTTPRGDNVASVCREFDGKLAASPAMGAGRGGRGHGRDCYGHRGGGKEMGMGRGMGMGPGQHFGRMARDLDLTAEQQGQIRTLLDAEWTKNAPLRQKMQDSREQLHRIAEKTPFDETVVRKLASEQEKTHVDLIVSRTRAMNKVYALLTPDQKEKAAKLGPFGMGAGKGRHDRPWR